MSFVAILWAETAPVADVYERAIVTMFAHRADDDGAGCFPSYDTLAEYAVCDERSIIRRIKALEARKLISPGDEDLVRKYDPRYRPKVWDLLIPYEWYSPDLLERAQKVRALRGDPLLTPALRPAITPAPARKRRGDVGVPRPQSRKSA